MTSDQERPAAATAAPTASTLAGYSGTPLHRKLGVRPGHRVLARGVPAGWDASVLDPDGAARVTLDHAAPDQVGSDDTALDGAGHDVVLLFCPGVAALTAGLPGAMRSTTLPGRCWVAWPKRASGVATDLTENAVRAAGLAVGWVDVKVCAIDAIWSGLCLVRRRENR